MQVFNGFFLEIFTFIHNFTMFSKKIETKNYKGVSLR